MYMSDRQSGWGSKAAGELSDRHMHSLPDSR